MKILLTGATGYIGRRLKLKLLEDEKVHLRLFVRSAKKIGESVREKVEIAEGDTFNRESLKKAVEGVDVAYYLIHSMGAKGDFGKLDRISATNFRDVCIEARVKRIVYLGGLGVKESASKHLLSRIETGEMLSARPDKIQTIWFRAGVIIGSGSASFEIIRNLVQKLPVMIIPRWVRTKTQPIAIDDVLNYLFQAKDLDVRENLKVDIGSVKMSYEDMMKKAARVMGLKRVMIPVPVLTPRLSSYWLILFTPVPYKVASALVEGLRSETVIQNDNAKRFFPNICPMFFEEAVKKAIVEIENNQIISRWCDSSAGEVCDIKNQDKISRAVFTARKVFNFNDIASDKIFLSVLSIGGERGWCKYDFLFGIRGFIDKFIGGCGNRGRRNRKELRVGDGLDLWKVVDIKKGKRLLLLAQMKLPGKAWLEFSIEGNKLIETAYFYPRGLLGRIYWHFFLPFHNLAFGAIAENVIRTAEKMNI